MLLSLAPCDQHGQNLFSFDAAGDLKPPELYQTFGVSIRQSNTAYNNQANCYGRSFVNVKLRTYTIDTLLHQDVLGSIPTHDWTWHESITFSNDKIS